MTMLDGGLVLPGVPRWHNGHDARHADRELDALAEPDVPDHQSRRL